MCGKKKGMYRRKSIPHEIKSSPMNVMPCLYTFAFYFFIKKTILKNEKKIIKIAF